MLLDGGQIRWDCRHYRGDKPCVHNRLCAGCAHYQTYSRRVCIIKIGALGDVIRTLSILPELRRRHPKAQITWVTAPASVPFLERHPLIDRLLPLDALTSQAMLAEHFDHVISLDKESAPCGLAMALRADRKQGIGLSPAGTPIPLNPEAMSYFLLGLSDDLKFKVNTKSHPQLLYESLGWEYRGQRYELPIDAQAVDEIRRRLTARHWSEDRPTLGVNVGAGRVFANKMWPEAKLRSLLEQFHARNPHAQVILLGGSDEALTMNNLHRDLPWTIHAGANHTPQNFIALVDLCDTLLSGDTMAMHVAIARRRGVVAMFGPTCEQEIDLFGLGEKLVAATPCSPCYKRACDMQDACINAVSIETVLQSVERVMSRFSRNSIPLSLGLRKAG